MRYICFLQEGRYYHTCPECGANLDPGEKCDCQDHSKKEEETKKEEEKNDIEKIAPDESGQYKIFFNKKK